MSTEAPRSLAEYIETIRDGLVCNRCGRYVGSLTTNRFIPPLYPIAFEDVPPDDEARSLVSFEWHLLGMLRQGKFVIRHPEREGACISIEQWAAEEEDDGEEDDSE